MGFPSSSAGKESTCNAGDPALIPRLGRYARERIGYLLQYSWASLVAQMVKNPPAMQESRVRTLGWEDPLEERMATHSSIHPWRIPMDRGAWWATGHGVAKSQTRLSDYVQQRLGTVLSLSHLTLEFIVTASCPSQCFTLPTLLCGPLPRAKEHVIHSKRFQYFSLS